jgi:hypothetical protein
LRQKFVDAVSRGRVQAHQHVGQVRERIEFVGDAGREDCVERGEIFSGFLVASKQEIFPVMQSSA